MTLTRRQRLRRVGIICCHTLRNLAYYRAWFDAGKPRENEQFWVSANSNFADIVVLEWCKVLADERGKQHWRKVVTDAAAFEASLLQALEVDDVAWKEYINNMRFLRDKFIAHLDDELVMTLPILDLAKASAVHLYEYLLANENETQAFAEAPASASEWYEKFFEEAKAVYQE
ncbi:hypothetical protein X899_3001 [Burkholderia pseudomallei TSV 25]|uniref:hypothetical protein n=1 Tax=Burkholderia pseudomallei TaxID=28450 RepID=UPI00050F5214|nr:hypothetical protein [Burkholderia pseudomallei]AIV47937.1 hypothetical protein X988_775 [Burkholderia pseudomallei TSV 48]KGC35515.1 hypothetical protein DO64_4605 [Burkholderia pseudomallei]KGW09692.1 hypothetical protein X899_3001 [Burkholderia pseudomallei TSV 25]KIX58648.1 hypothetical protein SZ29_09145 [Burkholderia pseudomallei]